ncbi:MAG: hypothetical protein ACPGVH_00760 [Chitinophagales bacterium]
MTKTKVLYIALAILVLLNLGLMGFMISKTKRKHVKKHPFEHLNPKQIIINKLNFNEAQVVLFTEEIKKHRKQIQEIETKIKQEKQKLYNTLISESPDKDSFIHTISLLQADIESAHYNHFLNIKAICKDNQLDEFEKLTKELSKVFGNHKKPKH